MMTELPIRKRCIKAIGFHIFFKSPFPCCCGLYINNRTLFSFLKVFRNVFVIFFSFYFVRVPVVVVLSARWDNSMVCRICALHFPSALGNPNVRLQSRRRFQLWILAVVCRYLVCDPDISYVKSVFFGSDFSYYYFLSLTVFTSCARNVITRVSKMTSSWNLFTLCCITYKQRRL